MSTSAPSAVLLKSLNLTRFEWSIGMTFLCRCWRGAASIGSSPLFVCRASATSFLHGRLGTGLRLKRQHPTGILRRQGTDLVQLLDFRSVKLDPGRADIVPQLIHGFCANDH